MRTSPCCTRPRKAGGAEALGEEDLGEPQDQRNDASTGWPDVTAVGAQPAAFALQVSWSGFACGGNAAHLGLGGEGLVTAEADGGIASDAGSVVQTKCVTIAPSRLVSWVQQPSFPTGVDAGRPVRA